VAHHEIREERSQTGIISCSPRGPEVRRITDAFEALPPTTSRLSRDCHCRACRRLHGLAHSDNDIHSELQQFSDQSGPDGLPLGEPPLTTRFRPSIEPSSRVRVDDEGIRLARKRFVRDVSRHLISELEPITPPESFERGFPARHGSRFIDPANHLPGAIRASSPEVTDLSGNWYEICSGIWACAASVKRLRSRARDDVASGARPWWHTTHLSLCSGSARIPILRALKSCSV
jgi:hypothetical protein